MWQIGPPNPTSIRQAFFTRLKLVTRYYREFSKLKATKFKQKEESLKTNLEVAQVNLQDDILDMTKQ